MRLFVLVCFHTDSIGSVLYRTLTPFVKMNQNFIKYICYTNVCYFLFSFESWIVTGPIKGGL